MIPALLTAAVLASHLNMSAAERRSQIRCYKAGSRDQTFDVLAQLGSHPGAILIIHGWGPETDSRVKAFDDMSAYYRSIGLRTLTVLITKGQDPNERFLSEKNAQLKLRIPIVHAVFDPSQNEMPIRIASTDDALLLLNNRTLVKQIHPSKDRPIDPAQFRSWIEVVTGPLPIQPQAYLQSAQSQLPQDPEELREWVISQSLELHRVHREMKAATAGIPKYRPRTQMRMKPEGDQK